MQKQFLSLLCALLLASVSTLVSAQAAEYQGSPATVSTESGPSQDLSVSISDGVIGYGEPKPAEPKPEIPVYNSQGYTNYSSENSSNGRFENSVKIDFSHNPKLYPFEIRYEERSGAPVIIKSFRVPAGVDPATLIEADFVENGYAYTHKDILMREGEKQVEEKTVTQQVSFTTEKDDKAALQAALEPMLEYSQDGFSGQLLLDYNSIVSTPGEKENYSYPITKTVDVHNLPSNDYSFLSKNLDGLTLQSAEWQPQNGVYTAHATYKGVGYGTRVNSYQNSARYTGTVTRILQDDSICSVIYQGKSLVPWPALLSGATLLILLAILVNQGVIIIPAIQCCPVLMLPEPKGEEPHA